MGRESTLSSGGGAVSDERVIVSYAPQSGALVQQIPLDDIETEPLRQAVRTWRAQAIGHQLPSRAQLTPRKMAPFLRYVSLVRVVDEDGEFEYRIAGDAAVEAWGQSLTGLNSAGLDRLQDNAGTTMRACCQIVLQTRNSVAVRGTLPYIAYETVLLPLASGNGVIEEILVVTAFMAL